MWIVVGWRLLIEHRLRVVRPWRIEWESHASALRHHAWRRTWHTIHAWREGHPVRHTHRRALLRIHRHRAALRHIAMHHGTLRALVTLKAHVLLHTETAWLLMEVVHARWWLDRLLV